MRKMQLLMTALALPALLAACATAQQKMLDQKEDTAIRTVAKRAQFEMDCSGADPVVLSREVTKPPANSRYGGTERLEYTIGFKGCGQRKTYVVICPAGGEGCFASDGRHRY